MGNRLKKAVLICFFLLGLGSHPNNGFTLTSGQT